MSDDRVDELSRVIAEERAAAVRVTEWLRANRHRGERVVRDGSGRIACTFKTADKES
jgi:hypothetical protein